MPIKIKCKQCGSIFTTMPSNKNAKYCSKDCANLAKRTGHDVCCENCGKIFYRRQYLIDRNERQFCSIQCQKDYIHKHTNETRKCEICGAEFECSKLSKQRFCSNECNAKWQKTICGQMNPQFTQQLITCETCGKIFYDKISHINKNKHHFCCTMCRQKWFTEIHAKDEEYIELRKKIAVKSLQNGNVSRVNSYPQQIIDELLDKLQIKYSREYSITYYSIDNYLNDSKLMIEIMGDYWHSNPIIYYDFINQTQFNRISKDKAKHSYVQNNYNIQILYLWEFDIVNQIDLCKELILTYINNNGILSNYNSFNYSLTENAILQLNNKIIYPYFELDINDCKKLINII